MSVGFRPATKDYPESTSFHVNYPLMQQDTEDTHTMSISTNTWQEALDIVEEAEVEPERTLITETIRRAGELFDNALYRQKRAAQKAAKDLLPDS